MNVVCIGLGYVGSVTGAAFAACGFKTTAVDIDREKVDLINRGFSPLYEPGLDYLLRQTVGRTLFASTGYDAVNEADAVFIGVGTPIGSDGRADLKYVKAAAQNIGEHINKHKFTVIVNKSTVPVGTAEVVSSIISEVSGMTPERDFALVSNPEFLREGSALQDVFFPDRIVVGTPNPVAREIMRALYAPIITRVDYQKLAEDYFRFDYEVPAKAAAYFETDVRSAEIIKYAANAFLAVKISYINEIARFCEKLGANVLEVAVGIGLDSRIGDKFLQVSSGWQGSCFPKDTAELYLSGKIYDCELRIVKAAIEANLAMHRHVVGKIVNSLGCLNGRTVGILGLTFKPDTDDVRKTQAEYIIPQLLSFGAKVQVYDPQGMEMFKRINPDLDVCYCDQPEDVAKKADCILLLTHWQQFKKLNWREMANQVKAPYVLDTRNFLDKEQLREFGLYYEGLGLKGNPCLSRNLNVAGA